MFLAVLLVPISALAQSTAADEIPARLRHFEGTVTVQRAAVSDSEAAVVNLPLGRGDRVVTAADGRVEITLNDGGTFWLDARSSLDFLSLPAAGAAGEMIVRLWAGSLYVDRPLPTVGRLGALRIDAPNGTVTLDRDGLFRVDLDESQNVWLSVYDGAASLTAGGLTEVVSAGQRSLAEAGTAPARAAAFNTVEIDDFDGWRADRVALYADSRQYVQDREYIPRTIAHHAADLEPYGTWAYDTSFSSWYWKPHAAVAWTPYRHGRWVYTYGGWSWVPSAPWGYVTTHYGRWHQTGYNGWVWFPGSVWAPASVHWYVGPRYVGWVPLNYYGRPAVSFGVHFGGRGYGLSVGFGFGGYYGWGYPYYQPYYGCCSYYGRGGYGSYGRYTNYDYGRRGIAVGKTGSAFGGRAVNGLGYRAGQDAWTVVPQESFGAANTARRAIARNALPPDLDRSSRTLLSGTLRAREPSRLTPTTRAAVSRDGYRSTVDGDRTVTGAVRSTNGTTNVGARRTAVSRSGYRSVPANTQTSTTRVGNQPASGAVRSTTGRSPVRAQPRATARPRSTLNPTSAPRRTVTPAPTLRPSSSYARPATYGRRPTGSVQGPVRGTTRSATPRTVSPTRRPSAVRPSSPSRMPAVRPGGTSRRPFSGSVPTARPRVSAPRPSGTRPSMGSRPSIARPSSPRPSVRRPSGAAPSRGPGRTGVRTARPRPGGKPPGGA